MVRAVLSGRLSDAEARREPTFGLQVPVTGGAKRTPQPAEYLESARRIRSQGTRVGQYV